MPPSLPTGRQTPVRHCLHGVHGNKTFTVRGGGGNRASATWKERQRVPSYDLFFAKLVAGNERPPRPPAPKTIKKHNVCGDDAMMTRFPQGDATTRQAAAMRDARQPSRKERRDFRENTVYLPSRDAPDRPTEQADGHMEQTCVCVTIVTIDNSVGGEFWLGEVSCSLFPT